jgi:N utilization substance protein B
MTYFVSMNTDHSSQAPSKTRRDVRVLAMQVLYAYEISQEPIEMLLESIAGEELADAPEQYTFAQGLVYAVLHHRDEADTLIRARSEHWDFNRIALLDRVLLRMGVVEFLHYPDIPTKVTMNECVEIAKQYSTDQSSTFVNGMLDGILRQLRSEDRIRKSGRGLVDSSSRTS